MGDAKCDSGSDSVVKFHADSCWSGVRTSSAAEPNVGGFRAGQGRPSPSRASPPAVLATPPMLRRVAKTRGVAETICNKDMSYRQNVNHRYGQGQQPYKRPRDDGDRDPRGPREGRDIRDTLGQDSSRPPIPQHAASHAAAASGASKEVDGIMLARGDAAVEWEILNGLLVKDENMRLLHIPVSLQPIPFPRSVFNSIWDLQALLQKLYVCASQDHEFLTRSLAPVLGDEFTSKLWGIYCRVRDRVGACKTVLAVTRSDYMLSRAPGGQLVTTGAKQIEFNSLSVGGLPWTSKVAGMHCYLTSRYPRASDTLSATPPQPSQALSEVAQAIAIALESYCRSHCIDRKDACVLHIQGHPKYAHNVTDQEGVEVEAVSKQHLNWVKKTFGDLVYDRIQLQANGRLKIASPLGSLEVAVVYYRCGWSPDDYRKPEMFAARETLELSAAIKCPNIAFHLTGLKKMQESLAQPGALERFVGAADARRLRSVFEEMHSAADAATGKLEHIRAQPRDWVLKPQREGGGNNKFGDDVAKALCDWPISKLQEYVIMRRIDCPAVPTFCVRKSQTCAVEAVSEVGIYGVYFSCGSDEALNKAVGYVVRSKEAHVNEAGILHGGGFVDSLRIVDDEVWADQVVGSSRPKSAQSQPSAPSSSSSSSSSSSNASAAEPSAAPSSSSASAACAGLPPFVSWTLAAESAAVSEAARWFALAAARDVFHSDLNLLCQHHPMLPSASSTLFASLLSVFTSTKRGPTVQGVWWSPLLHSCSLDGGNLVFEENVMHSLRALVSDKLALHFEVNDVWKAKQSAQQCAHVKRSLRVLQQLRIVDDIPNFQDLNHSAANDWEALQLQVQQQAVAGLVSLTSSVVTCFHRALVGQNPSFSVIGSQSLAERHDNGLWTIRIQDCPAPVIEIHDSRLQRMWAAFHGGQASSNLFSKFFEAVYACLLRYHSTMHCASGRYSHHFGIPSGQLPSIVRAVAPNRDGERVLSNWIDCFSSPMTILALASDVSGCSQTQLCPPSRPYLRFCSPYADTDSCFGSLGSFFDADFEKITARGDVLFLHPPNDAVILERVTRALKSLFVDQRHGLAGVCVFPSTKPLLKMQEALQSVAVWQPVAAPVFCSGHPRDDAAVSRLGDCEYRVGSLSHRSELQVALKPLLSSLVAAFHSAAATMVPPQITAKNSSQFLTKLESDRGQAMLKSAVRDSAMHHKFSSIARGYVEQVHSTFCCPASIVTVVNAARQALEKLRVQDFFTREIEAILPQEVIASSGVALECLPVMMRAHGCTDCSATLASSCTCSEFRAAAISALNHPSSFIIVNFSRRALNQKGWGHFSPLAAYDDASDSFLVMDVEASSGFHDKFWVTCDVLYAAMVGCIADGSGRSRGWVQASIPSGT